MNHKLRDKINRNVEFRYSSDLGLLKSDWIKFEHHTKQEITEACPENCKVEFFKDTFRLIK